ASHKTTRAIWAASSPKTVPIEWSRSGLRWSPVPRRARSMNSAELAHRHGGVGHAVGEAPSVVVPGKHAHELALDHLGLLQVEGRARRVVVEVGADQRLVVGLEDALQALAGGGDDRLVDRLDRGLAGGGELEIDQGDVRRRHAD